MGESNTDVVLTSAEIGTMLDQNRKNKGESLQRVFIKSKIKPQSCSKSQKIKLA